MIFMSSLILQSPFALHLPADLCLRFADCRAPPSVSGTTVGNHLDWGLMTEVRLLDPLLLLRILPLN